MTTINRFSSALFVTLSLLALSARAQTPSVSTINIMPDEQKVRIAAVGGVLDMRVAVSDEAGDIVFESGPVTGEYLDWAMSDPQGQKLPAGTYNMTVTYRMPSGKLRRRIEQVLVSEEVSGGAEKETSSTQAPAVVGTITGQGTANKVAKFTGANTIGDSALTESGGRLGVGTPSPQQSIHAVGTSSRLRLQSTNAASLTTTEYVTNNRVWQSGAGGSTAANGVANKFFVFDQTANQFRLVLDTAGNFGIGTTAPTSKLTVNGGIQILGAGNGIKFADGSIQTKATAGTITGTGTTNQLVKFTGPNSFGNSVIKENAGNIGIGTPTPTSKLTVETATANYGIIHKAGTVEVGTWAGAGSSPEGGWFGTKSNHPLYFFTNNGAATVALTTDGNARFAGSVEVGGNLQLTGIVTDDIGQGAFYYGLPKAMLRIQGDGTQVRCYNAAIKVFSSNFAACGFSVSGGGGVYTIDFGAAVDNTQLRFVSLSGSSSIYLLTYPGTHQIQVSLGNATSNYAYYVIVF